MGCAMDDYKLKKVIKAYGELGGDLHLVSVERGSNGLGLSLVGNRDLSTMSVFVFGIQPNSTTAQDGRVHVGDELLEANGQVIYGRSHLNASAIIKSLQATQVKLLILRRNDYTTHMALPPLDLPEIRYKDDPNTLIPKHLQFEKQWSTTSIDSDTSLSLVNTSQSATSAEPEPQKAVTSSSTEVTKASNENTPVDLSQFDSIKTLTLQRGSHGLGFAIQDGSSTGQKGIFIKTISPNSPAAESGALHVGNQLVLVQDNSLVGVTYDKAIELIRSCRGAVKLTVNQNKAPAPEVVATANQNTPSISKPANHATLDSAPSPVTTNHIEETEKQKAESNHVSPSKAAKDIVSNNEELLVTEKPSESEPKSDPASSPESSQPSQDTTPSNTTTSETTSASPARSPSPVEPVEDPATVVITPGKETIIEIQKGRTGLGLSIVGGVDTMLGAIIIHEVYEDGAAARDARLWAGDQILEVNGEDLRDASHERAIQVLRQTPAVVHMVVFRDETMLKDDQIYDIFNVELMKKPGKGLGLSIVGRRNDTGVFISDIVKGGVADADGHLRQGDQILKVNDEDLKNAAQEHAAALLKTLMGKVVLTVGRLKGSSNSSSRRNSSQTGSDRAMKKSESSLSNKGKNKHSKTFSTSSTLSGSGSGAPCVREVTVARDSSGSLGLSIAGGKGSAMGDMPIVVASLAPHGAAALCGEIKEGDHILSINGLSTTDVTHLQAVNMLKSAQAIVTLTLIQGEDLVLTNGGHDDSAFTGVKHGYQSSSGNSDLDTSTLSNLSGDQGKVRAVRLERGSEGLGFSIVGGHNSPHGDLPIYIKTIFEQGAAAKNGSLRRGDQLVSVNGVSLERVTHEQAVAILKQVTGPIELKVLS